MIRSGYNVCPVVYDDDVGGGEGKHDDDDADDGCMACRVRF